MNLKPRFILMLILTSAVCSACTVKAVGDPERPITINAHITLDIKGLENTATDIENYVSGKEETLNIKK